MQNIHSFFIPIMGTSFTVESPVYVAKYGITSVLGIGDNNLVEWMREHHAKQFNREFIPITTDIEDHKAKRITAYLNQMNDIITEQIKEIKTQAFEPDTDLTKYYELLDEKQPLYQAYQNMLNETDLAKKEDMQETLRAAVVPGKIDVNIMTKVDRDVYDKDGNKGPEEMADGMSSLRGYAHSDIDSSIVFSAGFSRRLYAYVSNFRDFYPDENGHIKKRIVLKVSDYRSTQLQGKIFAKKGLWVSEYRIESGLNCGGHAFATDGRVMGPILEEFKVKRTEFLAALFNDCNKNLEKNGQEKMQKMPKTQITVQGGVGTQSEHEFLMRYYDIDAVGWATPFMLVPEATAIDDDMLELLKNAGPEDLYLSHVSPIGVRFNTIRGSSSEKLIKERCEKGKPGSPCPKKHLGLFNTEFTKAPICMASYQYQRKKIEQLKTLDLSEEEYNKQYQRVVNKACLCEVLAAGALVKHNIDIGRPLTPASCPGPNLAYFSKIMTLKEMVGHIYGKWNVLNERYRPHMFINELKIYVDYLKETIVDNLPKIPEKQQEFINNSKDNLLNSIEYYKQLIPKMIEETESKKQQTLEELSDIIDDIQDVIAEYKDLFKTPLNQPSVS